MHKKNEVLEVIKEYKEIIKEYYIITPKKNITVTGRVTKYTTEDHVVYGGSFSHFYLFAKDGPEYIGENDAIVVSDFNQADIRVKQYLEDFRDEFKMKKNKFFK